MKKFLSCVFCISSIASSFADGTDFGLIENYLGETEMAINALPVEQRSLSKTDTLLRSQMIKYSGNNSWDSGEIGVVFKSNSLYWIGQGSASKKNVMVQPTISEMAQIYPNINITVTHNHPGGLGFSQGDINNFATNVFKNMIRFVELHAVTRNKTYVLTANIAAIRDLQPENRTAILQDIQDVASIGSVRAMSEFLAQNPTYAYEERILQSYLAEIKSQNSNLSFKVFNAQGVDITTSEVTDAVTKYKNWCKTTNRTSTEQGKGKNDCFKVLVDN